MINLNPFAWARHDAAPAADPSSPVSPPSVPADLVVLREIVLNNAETWSNQSLHDLHGHGSYGETPFALTISSSGRPQTPFYVRGTVGDRTVDVKLDNKSDYNTKSFKMQGTETAPDGTSQEVRGEWYVNKHAVEQNTSGKFVNTCSIGDSELSGKGKAEKIELAIQDFYKHQDTLARGEALQTWQDHGIPYVGREAGRLKTPERCEPFTAQTAFSYAFSGNPVNNEERCTVGQTVFDNKLTGFAKTMASLEGTAFGKPLTFIED